MPTLALPDGRRLAYEDAGHGPVVVHHHSAGACRLERPADARLPERLGLRLVTVDRPGHGGSDAVTDRPLAAWADDLAALLDHLRVDRVHLTGAGHGAAFALAAASRLGFRVSRIGLVGPTPPPEGGAAPARPLACLDALPGIGALVRAWRARVARTAPEDVLDRLEASLPDRDVRLLRDASVRAVLGETLREAVVRHTDGAVTETRALGRPWGIALEDVHQPVDLWAPTEDPDHPIEGTEHLADRLPSAMVHRCRGDGPLVLHHRWEQVLRTAAGRL